MYPAVEEVQVGRFDVACWVVDVFEVEVDCGSSLCFGDVELVVVLWCVCYC